MRYAAVLALLIAIVPACGTQQELDTSVQAATVRASLDSLWSQYAVASDQRDSIAFGSLFHEDAVLVRSGEPTVTGRDAIARFLASAYTGIDARGLRVTVDDLRVHGPLAVETGTFEEKFAQADVEKTKVGRFVLVAEPDATKSWRIRRLVVLADSIRAGGPA